MNIGNIEGQSAIEQRAMLFLRFTLVLIFVIFGLQKFTLPEAQAVVPLIANSPFISWLGGLGIEGASRVIGCFELLFGAMLAVAFWRPGSIVAVLGGVGGVGSFLTTLSFLFTTPGVFVPGHAPILSANGLFLLKDIVLLAVSTVLLAQSLAARGRLQNVN
ncbi:DUF417 family protein [Sphingomonas sp. PAMC 26605]|uniref:DUF417 family protein n=1 Tax=Sphingomonas sp. PAMC 26605 TaxID=1112214 RepID=UPI00026CB117|nr:DUF417 family protein [Sphingomonas sp. PAMC 26605]